MGIYIENRLFLLAGIEITVFDVRALGHLGACSQIAHYYAVQSLCQQLGSRISTWRICLATFC